MVMQFRKICNHPYVFEEVENAVNPQHITDDRIFRVAGKFELLDRILLKLFRTGHRVLMFFQMTQIMDIMEDFLRYRGMQFMRLDGSTKTDERSEMLKLFNAPNSPYFIFLLSTRAGGLGLNLQTADTVIIFDSDWNPHQDLQAQDRAHRIGQTKEVRILRLITSRSVEETILARAQYKLDIDGKVIQAGKFDNKTSEAEREALLRSLLGTGDADDKDNDEEEGELDNDELNETLARNADEIRVFKEIDKEIDEKYKEKYESAGLPVPPRLMPDEELPAIYLVDPNEYLSRDRKDETIYGRGGRSRKEVKYDDGLTEEQWLDAVDSGNLEVLGHDEKDKTSPQPDDKPSKRAHDTMEATPDPEGGSSAPKKKRGRPPRPGAAGKSDDPYKNNFGINPSETDPLPPDVRKSMTEKLNRCYKELEDVEVEEAE
jgi:ATP-dependent helicase STH1/SNF2